MTDPLLNQYGMSDHEARKQVYDGLLAHYLVRAGNDEAVGAVRRRAYRDMRELTAQECREVTSEVLRVTLGYNVERESVPEIVERVKATCGTCGGRGYRVTETGDSKVVHACEECGGP